MFRTFCIVCSPSPSSIFFSKEKGDQIYQHVNLFAKPSSLVPPQRPWQPDRAEGDLPGTQSPDRGFQSVTRHRPRTMGGSRAAHPDGLGADSDEGTGSCAISCGGSVRGHSLYLASSGQSEGGSCDQHQQPMLHRPLLRESVKGGPATGV